MAVRNQIPYHGSLVAEIDDSRVSQHLSEKLPPALHSLALLQSQKLDLLLAPGLL